jgi:hypothetical protein
VRILVALFALAYLLLSPSIARADLADDVQKLVKAWKKRGRVEQLPLRMLERGQTRPLLLPPDLTDPASETCVSVAVLGSSQTSFLLRFLPGKTSTMHWPEGEYPEQSIAGAAQLVRCGARKLMLERLVVEMRSPRAIVEFVVVEAKRPLPPLTETLTQRNPGPGAPLGFSGPRPGSAPLDARVRSVESRARRQGARQQTRRAYRIGRDGVGAADVTVDSGCHRVDVLGPGVDLDADISWVSPLEVLAVDRTESSDAKLSFCSGEKKTARLRVSGGVPNGIVMVLWSRWDLPEGVPESWPPELRSRMANAIRQRHARELRSKPVYSSLGVSGVTLLPVELDPNSCYLGAVAAIRGEPSGIAISADLGEREAQNRSGPFDAETAVAFCSEGKTRSTITVEANTSGVAWVFGLWRVGKLPIGGAK